jgi:tetratricopeptide (TPR) repeat protein
MSLIRQALKKAADETEPPAHPPSEQGMGKKDRTFPSKQIVLVLSLLIILGGVLLYSFFPTILPGRKTPPPAPQPTAKQIQIKTPETGPVKQKAPEPPKVSEMSQAKGPQSSPAQAKQFPEQGPAKLPSAASKTDPGSFISPRATPRIVSQTFSVAPRPVAKTRGPSEKPGAQPPQAPSVQEETDALQAVRLFNEAVTNQQKGLFPQAIQAYQEILFLRPNHWETYNNLGLVFQEQKRYPQALEMFQKAIFLNPRYLKGFNNLGLCYLNLGKYEEAGTQFRKAIDLDPRFLPAQINSAVVLNRQGQAEKARKVLLKVLEYDPENIEAHYNLGFIWEEEGVPNKALEHYKKFIFKAQGPYLGLADELKKRWPELR